MKLNKPLIRGEFNFDIVGLSFFLERENNFKRAIDWFEENSIKYKLGENIFKKYYNTTAPVDKRVSELHKAFSDNNTNIVLNLDGGCTAIELLDKIDYNLIQKNIKPFIGFSDITHIQLALLSKAKLPSLYGVDIINGFGAESLYYKENIDNLFKYLMNANEIELENYEDIKVLKPGKAEGVLIGGWLTGLADLCNTEYWPDIDEDIILFFEEVESELHTINIHLNVLKLSGRLKNLKGVIIGEIIDCEEKEYFDCTRDFEKIVLDNFEDFDIPIISNVSFGHGDKHLTLPVGLRGRIDSSSNKIEILEKYLDKE